MSKRQREKSEARRKAAHEALPHAQLNLLRMPASKVRLVVDLVRGKPVEQALNIITFTPKYASLHLAKLLRSAVANADQKGGYDVDRLIVKDAQVGEGPQMKRFRPRAMGRAGKILKRSCHVTFQLALAEGK
jgi:large subunit ribosomal protein L22